MKITNLFGSEFTGTLGKAMTAATWNGRNYIRGYRKPHNPLTDLQLAQRDYMRDAGDIWKDFEREQKFAYDLSNAKHAGRITNYNSMAKQVLITEGNGEEYVAPFYGTAYIKNALTGEWINRARMAIYSQGTREYYLRWSDEVGAIEGMGLVAEDEPYKISILKDGFDRLEMWDMTGAEVITTYGLQPE